MVDDQITCIRQRADCTSLCSLSRTYNILEKSWRIRHNGVRFSHVVDIDEIALRHVPDDGEEMLSLWCREHHAGRDGHEIQIDGGDGVTRTLLIPEAVGL